MSNIIIFISGNIDEPKEMKSAQTLVKNEENVSSVEGESLLCEKPVCSKRILPGIKEDERHVASCLKEPVGNQVG